MSTRVVYIILGLVLLTEAYLLVVVRPQVEQWLVA